ncbi:MAG: cell division protein ZapA [Treponema sp.]|jgi:cell division protein ZapA (FtsZ GTPase activity inhibitor)|nr:cell division protein ZapA [Treponema sp.]
MMTQGDLHLDILGTSFSITADEDAAYLDEILKQYKSAIENTQNAAGLKDPLKIAVLTGFLLCDEIHKLKANAGTETEGEAEKLTLALIARIDDALSAEKTALEAKRPFDE